MTLEHEDLTKRIIGAAIEVHRGLGPGFLESVTHAHQLKLHKSLPHQLMTGWRIVLSAEITSHSDHQPDRIAQLLGNLQARDFGLPTASSPWM